MERNVVLQKLSNICYLRFPSQGQINDVHYCLGLKCKGYWVYYYCSEAILFINNVESCNLEDILIQNMHTS